MWQLTIGGGLFWGFKITIGNNGGSGFFNGQWNYGAYAGFGEGAFIRIDPRNLGCHEKGAHFGIEAEGDIGLGPNVEAIAHINPADSHQNWWEISGSIPGTPWGGAVGPEGPKFPLIGVGEGTVIGVGGTSTINMNLSDLKPWLILRVLVIAVNILGIATYPQSESNLDWYACALISVIVGAGLFSWLAVYRARANVDWSQPYSLEAPFFPMMKQPLRFWFLISVAFMLAGGVTVSQDLIAGNGHEAFGGTFFFMGLAILLAIRTWLKVFGSRLER